MKPISLKVWITWGVILFCLGVGSDYYFWHLLFQEKVGATQDAAMTPPQTEATATPEASETPADDSFISEIQGAVSEPTGEIKDNFLESLKACAPEVAAQAIATPEALMEYLQKSIGVKTEEVSVENFHLTLPDGSKRRVHVVISDNTNSTTKKEIRFFKLDAEGYPERLPLKGDETLKSLLAQGTQTRHEARLQLLLKDGSSVNLERHDQKVFEFQFANHGKVLSCRFKECLCN
ncbi:MAG: hypothetical protein HUU57_06115 [Bdellovibrio sp.]|nr:hypothetical protein [Bdellovibrio sp.]